MDPSLIENLEKTVLKVERYEKYCERDPKVRRWRKRCRGTPYNMFHRLNKRTRVVAAIFNHQRRKFVKAKIKGSESKHQVKYANNRRKFVDRVRVSLIGGNGGLGCISHKHLGPGKKRADGGDAGKGGDMGHPVSSSIEVLQHKWPNEAA